MLCMQPPPQVGPCRSPALQRAAARAAAARLEEERAPRAALLLEVAGLHPVVGVGGLALANARGVHHAVAVKPTPTRKGSMSVARPGQSAVLLTDVTASMSPLPTSSADECLVRHVRQLQISELMHHNVCYKVFAAWGVTLLWHNASPNAQRLVLLPEGPRMMVPASPTCFACYNICLGRCNSLNVSYTQEDMLCGVLAAGEQRTSGTRR